MVLEFITEVIRSGPGPVPEWPAIIIEDDPPARANIAPPGGDILPDGFERVVSVDMQKRDLTGIRRAAEFFGCKAVPGPVLERRDMGACARIVRQAMERRQIHAKRVEHLLHGQLARNRIHGGDSLPQVVRSPRVDA
jgi:hypothetical protein